MGHRHMFNMSQIFETDNNQGWSHGEQPYMPMGVSTSESSSHLHPLDNVTIQGQFPSQWIPAPRTSSYSSSVHNGELPHYQPLAPGASRDNYLHQSAAGNFHVFQDNHSHRPSSSNLGGQAVPGVNGGFYDQTMGNIGPCKRKSPGVPPPCDRGSTSRYYDVGSSSDIHLPTDPWQEKQSAEPFHGSLEYPSNYRVNNLSTGGEGTLRNVRSRAAVDLETNAARTLLTCNSLHHSYSSRSSDQSNAMDIWGQSSNDPTREWNRTLMPPTGTGVVYCPDSSFYSHDPSALNALSHPGGSIEVGGYSNEVISNRNPVPQNLNSNLTQPVRGVRSSYGQRTAPPFRASSSVYHPGHVSGSDEGLPTVVDRYPSRHARASSSIRLRNTDRNGRSLIMSDRYRSFAEASNLPGRFGQEGFVAADHAGIYGSRFDQHRDMRLDVDNMSYEELLALGERIGSVNTGLSDGSISKCLTESICCSSDGIQDEGTCVICLEEYKNLDDVGSLKVCGHDFHVGCIRQWLSLKNMCPICKACALDDSVKDK